MSSKNKTCNVLKRKHNVISLKTKLYQIGNSDSRYELFEIGFTSPFSGTFYDVNRENTVLYTGEDIRVVIKKNNRYFQIS